MNENSNFFKALVYVFMAIVGVVLITIAIGCGSVGACKYASERCFANGIQICDQYGEWQMTEECQDWAPIDDPYAAMICTMDPLKKAHCITGLKGVEK